MTAQQFAILKSHPSWNAALAEIYEEMNVHPKRVEDLINQGMTRQQALSAVLLEGFVIQARAILKLVADQPTLESFLAYLPSLAKREVERFQGGGAGTDDWNFVFFDSAQI